MRVIFAALFSLLLTVDFIKEQLGLSALQRFDPSLFPGLGNLLLEVLFSVYLVIEGVFLFFRSRIRVEVAEDKQAVEKTETGSAQNKQAGLEAQLARADEQLAALRSKQHESEEQSRRLQKALAAAEAELRRQRSSPRDESVDAEVVNLLSLFQDRGRLIDFLMDDVTRYDDNRVGAAARVVHQGCRSVLAEYFSLQPVHEGTEGNPVSLEQGYDARAYRLLGAGVSSPPYRGRLAHRGWKTAKVSLPRVSWGEQQGAGKAFVICPAEIDVSS